MSGGAARERDCRAAARRLPTHDIIIATAALRGSHAHTRAPARTFGCSDQRQRRWAGGRAGGRAGSSCLAMLAAAEATMATVAFSTSPPQSPSPMLCAARNAPSRVLGASRGAVAAAAAVLPRPLTPTLAPFVAVGPYDILRAAPWLPRGPASGPTRGDRDGAGGRTIENSNHSRDPPTTSSLTRKKWSRGQFEGRSCAKFAVWTADTMRRGLPVFEGPSVWN